MLLRPWLYHYHSIRGCLLHYFLKLLKSHRLVRDAYIRGVCSTGDRHTVAINFTLGYSGKFDGWSVILSRGGHDWVIVGLAHDFRDEHTCRTWDLGGASRLASGHGDHAGLGVDHHAGSSRCAWLHLRLELMQVHCADRWRNLVVLLLVIMILISLLHHLRCQCRSLWWALLVIKSAALFFGLLGALQDLIHRLDQLARDGEKSLALLLQYLESIYKLVVWLVAIFLLEERAVLTLYFHQSC